MKGHRIYDLHSCAVTLRRQIELGLPGAAVVAGAIVGGTVDVVSGFAVDVDVDVDGVTVVVVLVVVDVVVVVEMVISGVVTVVLATDDVLGSDVGAGVVKLAAV